MRAHASDLDFICDACDLGSNDIMQHSLLFVVAMILEDSKKRRKAL